MGWAANEKWISCILYAFSRKEIEMLKKLPPNLMDIFFPSRSLLPLNLPETVSWVHPVP
jgi:hypothetical protein